MVILAIEDVFFELVNIFDGFQMINSYQIATKCFGKPAFAIFLAFLFAVNIQAQNPPYKISYELAMPNPSSHLFEVKMTVETPLPNNSFDIQMPRWSPGRYAIFEFAKGIQEVQASTGCSSNIENCVSTIVPVTRSDTQTWHLAPKKGKITVVTYKFFANNLSGTFSQLDNRHANFNPGTIFMYVVNHKQDSVRLKIAAPPNWKIMNGRMDKSDQVEWKFENYDILMDTPTEIAPDFTVDEFNVDGKIYRVMVHSFGDEGGKRQQFVKDLEKIVRTQTAMMGIPDFESYTFMFHFAPNNESGGDAMEHLTSTQIIETDTLASENTYSNAIWAASHEFFHVWNVKRLRPVGLGPWDFTQPVKTRGLFIAEGFTNYYGNILLLRAGLWTEKQFIDYYSRKITSFEESPGSKLMSAEESSIIASFLDGSAQVQNTNLSATTINYYAKGELLALTLDLMIRKRSKGVKSLDDVMRKMYQEFYLKSPKDTYYLKGRAYTIEDFEGITSQVTGVEMSDFFTRYVRGVETPPYNRGLVFLGLELAEINSGGTYEIQDLADVSAEMLIRRKNWFAGNISPEISSSLWKLLGKTEFSKSQNNRFSYLQTPWTFTNTANRPKVNKTLTSE
jgi:predicted metalloprotease with PDZ domain